VTAEPDAFVAEFKRWRDVRGFSQTGLAKRMGYDRSYISKIENAHERPTRDFAERADEVLQAGGAIRRAFLEWGGHRTKDHVALPRVQHDPQAEAGNLVVEHDDAELRSRADITLS